MWRSLLRKAILAEGSQAAVARRIGYSPAALSMALAGNYNGGTASIAGQVQAIYGDKTMTDEQIPEGYKKNGVGALIPIESIKEVDLLRDQFVREQAEAAKDLSAFISYHKSRLATDLQAFIELSAEKYGADMGGSKGNVSLTSFDGRYKLLRAISDRLDFNERLQAAKTLVDQCLREWTKDSSAEVRALIDQAFQVDKKGKVNTKRILGLRQLKIEHPTWQRAMEAIGDAIQITGSCTYYRVYERDERGEYQQIPLDFSGV